jgi:hypothetical protein
MLPTKFRFIWLSVSKENIFKNRPIRNKNCLWRPCLLMDRDKMSILYTGPSIYASYQVSVHMVEGFQRRRLKCEKLMDDRRRMPSDGKTSHCLWQGELKTIVVIGTDCTGSCKSNYHMIKTMAAPHTNFEWIGCCYTCIYIQSNLAISKLKWRMIYKWIILEKKDYKQNK